MRYYYDELNSLILEFNYPTDEIALQFPKEAPSFDVQKKVKGCKISTTKYIRVNMALDIETTTVFMFSVPYIITVSLHHPGSDQFYVYHCRNWEQCQKLMNIIAEHYHVCYNKKTRTRRVLLCLVHNLSYEFYFCRHCSSFPKCIPSTAKRRILTIPSSETHPRQYLSTNGVISMKTLLS